MKKLLLLIVMLFLPLLSFAAAKTVYLIDINGAIGPAIQEHVSRGIESANQASASAVILQIDTPGGLSKSMRGIIKSILASKIPVIGYVSPKGARAASAGTYILYACNIAAMAPGTNLGAATPVNIGGSDKATKKLSASQKKALNDARAYIRGLAQLRGRNVKWAEKAVVQGASLSAQEALRSHVINFIAADMQQLLVKSKLTTAKLVTIATGWRFKLLSIITDPTIAYLLLMAGFYGLFFEFASPGMIAPGVLGGICLLLGLYGLQMLPISYAGLALILLGMALMVTEIHLPSFGIVGIGGLIALIAGSILLLDEDVVGYTLSTALVASVATVSGLVFLGVIAMVWRSRRGALQSGKHAILDKTGEVVVGRDKIWLKIQGELWHISNPDGLKPGQKVTVQSVDGLKVKVKK